MLLEFTVENFLSFKDSTTFSMLASADNSFEAENTSLIKNVRLLKSSVIYGANASGKSNLCKALRFMKFFVLNSSRETQITDTIAIEPFRLNFENENQPSKFELVFYMEEELIKYGFECNKEKILSEWLIVQPKTKPAQLFSRVEQNIKIGDLFKEAHGLDSITRTNALFLSVVAQFNGDYAKKILEWFKNFNVISGLEDHAYSNYTMQQMKNDSFRKKIVEFVKMADLGIDDISVQETELTNDTLPVEMPEHIRKIFQTGKNMRRIETLVKHKRYKNGKFLDWQDFNLEINESEGTKKLFSLSAPLIDTLSNGKVLVIDELDARLHPIITQKIVRLFNSKDSNPNNAQLIIATHDTNLLSNKLFRRDQIWFTEKKEDGSTDLYSLSEYKEENKTIRKDSSFSKDYVSGRYGAIPFLGNFRNIVKK